MAAALTDVMVKFEGSEAFREVVWVLIEELHTDGWHIGGLPFRGPASLMDGLARSKSLYESIDGHPVTRPELAAESTRAGKVTPTRSPLTVHVRRGSLQVNHWICWSTA